MENFLIIIIFIGSVIYKIYSNFKKEAEKAKSRNPQQRPFPPTVLYEEKTNQEVKPVAREFSKPIKQIKNNYSYRNTEIPEEVQKFIETKKQKKHITLEVEENNEHKKQPIEFDLRQAVIQSAILERPYQ